jgi:fermentation-respiration switch protein FrsA (DUF1100 family)
LRRPGVDVLAVSFAAQEKRDPSLEAFRMPNAGRSFTSVRLAGTGRVTESPQEIIANTSRISIANCNGILLSAVVNYPVGFNAPKRYAGVIVSRPGGGVKELTAGTCARKLAENGFVTVAFDRLYQGESSG